MPCQHLAPQGRQSCQAGSVRLGDPCQGASDHLLARSETADKPVMCCQAVKGQLSQLPSRHACGSQRNPWAQRAQAAARCGPIRCAFLAWSASKCAASSDRRPCSSVSIKQTAHSKERGASNSAPDSRLGMQPPAVGHGLCWVAAVGAGRGSTAGKGGVNTHALHYYSAQTHGSPHIRNVQRDSLGWMQLQLHTPTHDTV